MLNASLNCLTCEGLNIVNAPEIWRVLEDEGVREVDGWPLPSEAALVAWRELAVVVEKLSLTILCLMCGRGAKAVAIRAEKVFT